MLLDIALHFCASSKWPLGPHICQKRSEIMGKETYLQGKETYLQGKETYLQGKESHQYLGEKDEDAGGLDVLGDVDQFLYIQGEKK